MKNILISIKPKYVLCRGRIMKKLVRQPPMKMEDDEARNKQIRIIESPNTPKDKVAKLVFQLNLYDLVMGYKKEV